MPTIRYLVVRGRSEARFNRPHEAWQYFQQLTGAPNKNDRPEPPPIDEAFLQRTSKPRRLRRGRAPKSE
jgi:hypothetical protein